jgi:light-regulated signal transduction histidine kinase (bacteriophytochrome)
VNHQPSSPPLDLTACDREPIHIPGSIQPHGFLLAIERETGRIAHASVNVADMLGLSAEALVDQDLSSVAPRVQALAAGALTELAENVSGTVRTVPILTQSGEVFFDLVAHRSDNLDVLEFEETSGAGDDSLDGLYPFLRSFVEQLQAAGTVLELCAIAADHVRALTGFDRVLIYQFDESWNGTVIGESRNDRLPSYLDLRFPASDIPAQARELYRRNRLRIIPDARYAPVPITPVLDAASGRPLDLSQSVLRSVSPVHVEYMHNMGTMASMSVSIMRDGALWGLISCHNAEARRVSLRVRNGCDFLTQIFSLQVAARERALEAEERIRLGSIQTRLLGYMAEEERFIDGLLNHPGELMALAAASGAAIISAERCWLLGRTPAEANVRRLHTWLAAHHREDLFATDALSAVLPEAEAYREQASGVLAISMSKMNASYLVWFRPEVIQTVKWGGDPKKPVDRADGPTRLHPRKSFEIWKETLQGRSAPWSSAEIAVAGELRNAIVGIVLRRAEEMAALSEELQRSNKELEAFSYSVSHDLRAPFRHIVGYSELLKKQEGEGMSERGRRYLETIIESAFTAGTLVDNLLHFSQMGRAALKPRRVDMNVLVGEIRSRLATEAKDRSIDWRIQDLSGVVADPFMLRLAVENLLSNAIKYTRGRKVAVIEISSRHEAGEVIFTVRDNGVGFDMAYVGKLFGVFQRLHRMEEFEGTGIGLANVRRIVERHGGRVWAEGVLNGGATFSFSLPAQEGA